MIRRGSPVTTRRLERRRPISAEMQVAGGAGGSARAWWSSVSRIVPVSSSATPVAAQPDEPLVAGVGGDQVHDALQLGRPLRRPAGSQVSSTSLTPSAASLVSIAVGRPAAASASQRCTETSCAIRRCQKPAFLRLRRPGPGRELRVQRVQGLDRAGQLAPQPLQRRPARPAAAPGRPGLGLGDHAARHRLADPAVAATSRCSTRSATVHSGTATARRRPGRPRRRRPRSAGPSARRAAEPEVLRRVQPVHRRAPARRSSREAPVRA